MCKSLIFPPHNSQRFLSPHLNEVQFWLWCHPCFPHVVTTCLMSGWGMEEFSVLIGYHIHLPQLSKCCNINILSELHCCKNILHLWSWAYNSDLSCWYSVTFLKWAKKEVLLKLISFSKRSKTVINVTSSCVISNLSHNRARKLLSTFYWQSLAALCPRSNFPFPLCPRSRNPLK